MSEPKFVIGQHVERIQEQTPKGAIILSISNIYSIVYLIKYDEGESVGNDGTGYWPEECLIAN